MVLALAALLALTYLQSRERPAPPSRPPASISTAPAPALPGEATPPGVEVLPDAQPPTSWSPTGGKRRTQVARVIESMDRTGRPPSGVAQGGRRDGPRGVFDNAQRILPVREYRYYTETDVWPRGRGGRGPERLVFGREGEVYYTSDHYRTFTRVR
jgi:guanyl-specific ribonuclease Sa